MHLNPFAFAGPLAALRPAEQGMQLGPAAFLPRRDALAPSPFPADWLGQRIFARRTLGDFAVAQSPVERLVLSPRCFPFPILSPSVPLLATVRRVMTAAYTYYVRTTGSDTTGDGSSGLPWLTVQKAIDTIIGTLDTAGQAGTIDVGAGTFSSAIVIKPILGGGSVTISGAGATTIISGGTFAIEASSPVGAGWTISNLKIIASIYGVYVANGAVLTFGAGLEFGAVTSGSQMLAQAGGIIKLAASYTISGGAGQNHMQDDGGQIVVQTGITCTVSANITVSAFAAASGSGGQIQTFGAITFSTGAFTVTGKRFAVSLNGNINVNGAGINYFPGTVAGTTASGGEYA